MSSIILEAKSLTKEYKQTLALDHINLQIKKGKIYGFIGQNGAGKTTFLRLVTGLAFPTSGTLSLWGNSGTEELQKQRKRIGSMIETPALFPSMTAYQNMEVQRIRKRQTMRLTLNETPLFYERRGFLHSSGSSDDQGIRSSNSAGSIFPCLSQRFGSSVRIYLK